jgi:hypothetical protein
MQEHLHTSSRLFDGDLFRCILESASLHSVQKDRRLVTAGVGEDRLAVWCEQLRYEVGESDCVLTLVEDVRAEDQIERPDTLYVRFAPVEKGDFRFQVQVSAGVVGCEVEGGLVVVRSEDFGALGEREDCGQPDATPQLDNAPAPKSSSR